MNMHRVRNSARAPESEERYRTLLEIIAEMITDEIHSACFMRIFWDWPPTRSPILPDFGAQLEPPGYPFPQAPPPTAR
jgi:hypothetical protein